MTRSFVRQFLYSIGVFSTLVSFVIAETVTISLNFGADEPPGIGSEIESGEPAGLLGTSEWNNLGLGGGGALTFDVAEGLIDSNRNVTNASVLWEAQNTWASGPVETSPGVFEGRGENNIDNTVPRNGDRNLMTGYIDSNAVDRFCTEDESRLLGNWCGANRVTVGGLPYGDNPYDVILYFNGGVLNRGGFVKINDEDPVVQHDTAPFNGTFDLSSEERDIDGALYTVYTGDVMIFSDVRGETLTINTHGFNLGNGTFRSFINGLEISGEVGGGGELTCDFNASGTCDIADIDALMTGVGTGSTDAALDLNNDGSVTDLDRDAWLAAAATENGLSAPYQVGDSNLDLVVDAQDLNNLGTSWQSADNNWSDGNFTGSGVDASDLNVLGLAWQQRHPDAPAAAAVPEPSGAIMVVIGLALLSLRRRR